MLYHFMDHITRRSFLTAFLIVAVLAVTLLGCKPQTPKLEESIIDGPPEPPPGFERGDIDELGGIQKIASDGSSLYYYEKGERIQLTPSLNWITIKFSTDDVTVQNDALQNIESLANTEQKNQLSDTEVILLPLRSGLSIDSLISNINLLRINSDVYSQVNPVFVMDGVEKAITDKFIVTFPADKNLEDINTINSSMGVTIDSIDDQNTNTYVLLISPNSQYDSLMMANMYYEDGYADEAMPLFIEIME